MNKIKDYQWPSFFIRDKKYSISKEKKISRALINKIENFFKKNFYYKVILFPSARAALASVLRFRKIDRSNEVFINKWVSHCIFNTVGKYTNISTSFKSPDIIIAVHKWGINQIFSKKKNIEITEDSVDSIILNKKDLFINKGQFEFFSLPKIIGSVSGGIIVTRNLSYYKFAKKEQMKNKKLGIYQSRQKFNDINKKKSFNTWLFYESSNTFLEYNSLLDIEKNLKNLEINKKIILKRKNLFRKEFNIDYYKNNKLGPVIPINLKFIKNHSLMKKNFLLRHIHKGPKETEKFQKVYLLPVHFKISQQKFNFYIKLLKKSIIKKNNLKKLN